MANSLQSTSETLANMVNDWFRKQAAHEANQKDSRLPDARDGCGSSYEVLALLQSQPVEDR